MMGLLGLGVIFAGRCEGCLGGDTLNLSENFGFNHKQGRCWQQINAKALRTLLGSNNCGKVTKEQAFQFTAVCRKV